MGKSLVIKGVNFSQVSVGTAVLDARDLVNFSTLVRENYFTSSGRYVNTPSCYFLRPENNKFGITTPASHASAIMFLKSRPSSDSDPIDACDMSGMQYYDVNSGVLIVPAGETQVIWNVPQDCKYIYIGALTKSFGDYTPKEAWFE